MPIGIGFAVPDACGYFPNAPNVGSSEKREIQAIGTWFVLEHGFRKQLLGYCTE